MSTMAKPPAAIPTPAAKLPEKTLRSWLHDMLLIREFEVRAMQAYQNRKIGGFLHIYIGQEAIAVGSVAATRPDDPLITAYRDHAHALARGTHPKHCMAELYGKIGGCAKGKGGSMHYFDKRHHLYGGHGIVGAQCPLGLGLAFANKYEDEVIQRRPSQSVSLCYLGDGALNQGAFHESMNLAGVLDIPVIYIVENNGYSMGTAIERGTTMSHELTSKAIGYGIESAVIDAMDVMKVHDGLKPVVDRCRETSKPAFVEMRTYRFKGHSMSDPRKYRSKEEEQRFEADDPIDQFSTWLIENRILTPDGYDEMTKDTKKQIRAAIKWADASPAPGIEELYRDVYPDSWGPYTGTTPPAMLTEQTDETEGND